VILAGENRSIGRRTSIVVTFSTANPTSSVPGRGKQKYWEKNLYWCPFVYHKSHIGCPEKLDPALCGERPAANRLTCGTTRLTKITVANKYRRMHTYSRTPLIRINWDDEPSGSAEIPDNWIFL
jgi:hypothetical protein